MIVQLCLLIKQYLQKIGIGTIWTLNGLANSDSPTCTYASDTQATAQYQTLSGCTTAIPLENDGGSGTACGHWDEECFGAELMTGFLGDDTAILSKITIAGIDDLGYTVDYSSASSYTSSNLASSCKCSRRNLRGEDEGKVADIINLGGHKRKLSEAGRAKALAYGNEMLSRYDDDKIGWAPFGFNRFTATSDDAIYIGDKVINVFYEENGYIFDVLVSKF